MHYEYYVYVGSYESTNKVCSNKIEESSEAYELASKLEYYFEDVLIVRYNFEMIGNEYHYIGQELIYSNK